MKNRFFILALVHLLLWQHAATQPVWDTLYFFNGQKVYGTLKKISLGRISFDIEGISLANIKMSKVRTIKASSKLYRIETTSRKVFFSTVQPSNKPGYVQVGDSTGGGEIPLDYIAFLTYFSASHNIFEGNIAAGYNYTKSSNIGRANLDGNLAYILKNYVFRASVSTIITSESGEWYRDRENVSLSGAYLINSRWKAVAFVNYQLNRQLGLKSRFQEGIGAGYNLLARPHTRLAALTGIVINQEKNFSDNPALFTAEIPLILDFDFFKFSKPDLSFSARVNAYNSITQKGRRRYDGEIRADWKIISDFTLNLQFYYNYDSKPPSGTGVDFDFGTVFGIGYKWD